MRNLGAQARSSADALVRVRPFAMHWRRVVRDRYCRSAAHGRNSSPIALMRSNVGGSAELTAKASEQGQSQRQCRRSFRSHHPQQSTVACAANGIGTTRQPSIITTRPCSQTRPESSKARSVLCPEISSMQQLSCCMSNGQLLSRCDGPASAAQLTSQNRSKQPETCKITGSSAGLLKRLAELKLAADAALSNKNDCLLQQAQIL